MLSIASMVMAQQAVGIFGGTNISTTSAAQSKWSFGGNVGIIYTADLSSHLGLQPRLVLGYDESRINRTWNDFYSQWNITVPVLASYRFELSNTMRLRLNVGPYVQWAVFGREKQLFTSGTDLGWWHADFGERTTFGLQIGPMLEFGKWFVTADYKHSLRSSKLSFDGKERAIQIGIGYCF